MTRATPAAEQLPKLAYSARELAAMVGISEAKVRQQMKANKLIPSYVDSKAIVPSEEAQRWLKALPTEPPVRDNTDA